MFSFLPLQLYNPFQSNPSIDLSFYTLFFISLVFITLGFESGPDLLFEVHHVIKTDIKLWKQICW